MSTASASPTLTTLPERAFSLHCSGLRSPAIAQQLGVPERTIRAWIARLRDDIAAENTTLLREEFIRAVEHLHQLSAAAWAAFEEEQAASHPLPNDAHGSDLASAETSSCHPLASASPTDSPLPVGEGPGVRSLRHSPRYLRLALDAQRHISRLFGHFEDLRAGSIDLNPAFSPTPDAESKIPAKTAIAIADLDIPAESAISAGDAETEIPAKTAMPPSSSVNLRFLPVEPRMPAKTAAASGSPLPAGGARGAVGASGWTPGNHREAERAQSEAAGSGVRFRIPAKTATPPSRPVTTPAFPATIPIHWRM